MGDDEGNSLDLNEDTGPANFPGQMQLSKYIAWAGFSQAGAPYIPYMSSGLALLSFLNGNAHNWQHSCIRF